MWRDKKEIQQNKYERKYWQLLYMERKKEETKIQNSIWQKRKKSCESRNFYFIQPLEGERGL